MFRTAAVTLLACCGAFCQEFEVATIKPAPPPDMHMLRVTMGGGPGTPDPGRLNYSNVTLKNVLAKAYNVKSYQISGPGWLDSERFDIMAKVPEGTTKEQFALMLQHLIADRFKLTIHREKKDLPAFALLVAKGGPKMKIATDDPGPGPGDGPPAPPEAKGGPVQMGRMQMGKDGFPVMPAGTGRGGNMMMMMNGRARLTASNQTMPGLCELLANQLDRPVVDLTELDGKYDFSLYYSPEGMSGPMGRMPMPPPGGGEGGAPGAAPATPDGETGPSLFTAVQEQLGLRLEARKSPVDLIVVDHVEKAPTDN